MILRPKFFPNMSYMLREESDSTLYDKALRNWVTKTCCEKKFPTSY